MDTQHEAKCWDGFKCQRVATFMMIMMKFMMIHDDNRSVFPLIFVCYKTCPAQDVSGVHPALTTQQRAVQRRLLSAAMAVVTAACPALPDTHTNLNMLPLLFQGWSGPGLHVDFSTSHTAVLCAGGAVVAAAVLRLMGAEVAEVPLLSVRPDLQHNGLGRVLLSFLERLCVDAGVASLVMPCLLPFGALVMLDGFGKVCCCQ